MIGLVPRQVAAAIPTHLSEAALEPGRISELASWLLSKEGQRDPHVRQWINFLAAQFAQYKIVYELFPKTNLGREGMIDELTVATSHAEMLVIANQLYILRSYDVEGCLLECGCFKGYSSCCLSIACRRLGYPMFIADSFAGLPSQAPETIGNDRVYDKGDYAGSRTEVERNLRTLGEPAGVELLEGWFSDTLKGWNRPIAVLWMDVNLTSSAVDVLTPCLPFLDPRGILFSHEFLPPTVKDSKIIQEEDAAGAIGRAMQEDDPDYTAAYVRGYLGVVARRTSLCPQSYLLVNELIRLTMCTAPRLVSLSDQAEGCQVGRSSREVFLSRPSAATKKGWLMGRDW